eukprot:augustus_masked-scaffold_13-processed-gene-3.0-mRNA-1 protein AED:0.28 eAED:0.28 QI:0/-1/0/1/-1/1/1/0/368
MEPIVMDNGSETTKTGFAGDDTPCAHFPSSITYEEKNLVSHIPNTRDTNLESQNASSKLNPMLKYPIEAGVVVNWDDMEDLWEHTFSQRLFVKTEDHPILLTEKIYGTTATREKTIQVIFEQFNVPATFLSLQSVLALYASGRTTGVVVDSGLSVSHTVPVYQGYCLPHAVGKFNFGGKHVSSDLRKYLLESKHVAQERITLTLVDEIKRSIVSVKQINKQTSIVEDEDIVAYKLPDGSQVIIGKERYKCAEVMFRTRIYGMKRFGICENLYNSIMKCDIDIRTDLYSNIVLSGGNTMIEGFGHRIKNELVDVFRVKQSINIVEPPERTLSTWRGGAIFASLSTFEDIWISKEEYDDQGPACVHRKCF